MESMGDLWWAKWLWDSIFLEDKVFLVSIICHCSKMQGGAEVTWHSLTLIKQSVK